MKRTFILLAALALAAASCQQKNSIEGTVANLGNDTIVIVGVPLSQYMDNVADADQHHDTIVAHNGRFAYNPPFSEPALLTLLPGKAMYKAYSGRTLMPDAAIFTLLWRPEAKLRLRGTLERYALDATVSGDAFNRELSRLWQQLWPQLDSLKNIDIALDSLMFGPCNKQETKRDVQRRDSAIYALLALAQHARTTRRSTMTGYALQNPAGELAGYCMAKVPDDTAAKYWSRMDTSVQRGLFAPIVGRRIERYNERLLALRNRANLQPGAPAPDFTLPSLSGAPLRLYAIQKELVVLDFWGSWCGWCVKGFPQMRKYYDKYRRRLEIVGIACNDREAAWRKAVEAHRLGWLHAINDTSRVNVRYGVAAYPTKIILDRDKKIVAVFIGESEDFYAKLDAMLK